MEPRILRPVLRLAVLGLAAATLAGCNLWTRLTQIGEAPPLTEIQNPVQRPGYRPVSMPMPAPRPVVHKPNSLWRAGARAFFEDQRAKQIGDILTVIVDINDKGQISNETERSRTAAEDASANAFLGYEQALDRIFGHLFPDAINPKNLVELDSTALSRGKGKVDRDETIQLKVAAVVAQVLPNGNMVIAGRQEVRVNYEVRELLVTGVIRPEDIDAANTITYDKIAEARISYGGRGQLTDVQQPRYGQQLYDIIFPF